MSKIIAEITSDEIASSWKLLPASFGHEELWFNSALMPICKSAALVGGSYFEMVFLPHKWNLDKKVLEVYEGDFMHMGLDRNIPNWNRLLGLDE